MVWSPTEVESLAVHALQIPEHNVRAHPELQLSMLMESIRNFGFAVPIVIDTENIIIAGVGRVMAAMRLGMPEVPCIRADQLTEAQTREFSIVDNRLSEMGYWDEEKLAGVIDQLTEAGMTIMGTMIEEAEAVEGTYTGGLPVPPKSKNEVFCPHCSHRFPLAVGIEAAERADQEAE